MVLGVGLIGGVGMVGSVLRVKRATGLGGGRALELAAPAMLCVAGALSLRALDESAWMPVTFSVALLGLRLIAGQILGQLGGGRVRAFDLAVVPLLVSSLALPLVPARVGVALAWANLLLSFVVTVGTYVGATLAIARVLDVPVLTLPPRR